VAIGAAAFAANTTGTNGVAIGNFAGQSLTTGAALTAIGTNAAQFTTTVGGVAIGFNSLQGNINGLANIAVGNATGSANGSGTDNTYMGQGVAQFTGTGVATLGTITGGSGYTDGTYTAVELVPQRTLVGIRPTFSITVSGGAVTSVTVTTAGSAFIAGDILQLLPATAPAGLLTGSGFTVPVATVTTVIGNTAFGRGALQLNTNGSANTMIGYQAGRSSTGSSNVFIGYQAGQNETGSNRLFIDNSNTATPLIYGEFDTNRVKINGDFQLTTKTPSSATDTGVTGTIAWDADYIYICIATNTWKRSAITSW
jgi:hypothetical protein